MLLGSLESTQEARVTFGCTYRVTRTLLRSCSPNVVRASEFEDACIIILNDTSRVEDHKKAI